MNQEDDQVIEDDLDEGPYESSKQRKVLIQPYDYAVRMLMDMVIEGDLVLDPDYQRKYRWSDEKASRFIESILLNIPVPVFYLAEEPSGKFSVIDGQQRLTSLFRFLKPEELAELFDERSIPELVLRDLKVRSDLNGARFKDLEASDRSLLAKRPMRCIVVLNESDETLKYEVFERLNSGSAALTEQEVRNCLFRGSFNELIKRLAKNARFQELIALPEKAANNMKDVELVLRFFAYRELDDQSKYGDSYTEYLNNYMEDNREISESRAAKLTDIFERTVNLIADSIGPGVAFRRALDVADPVNSRYAATSINGSIYESQMVALSRLIESGGPVPPDVRARVLSVFADPDFMAAVLQGTAKRAKALLRTRLVQRAVMPQ
jgi:hypothetical protein